MYVAGFVSNVNLSFQQSDLPFIVLLENYHKLESQPIASPFFCCTFHSVKLIDEMEFEALLSISLSNAIELIH